MKIVINISPFVLEPRHTFKAMFHLSPFALDRRIIQFPPSTYIRLDILLSLFINFVAHAPSRCLIPFLFPYLRLVALILTTFQLSIYFLLFPTHEWCFLRRGRFGLFCIDIALVYVQPCVPRGLSRILFCFFLRLPIIKMMSVHREFEPLFVHALNQIPYIVKVRPRRRNHVYRELK